MPRDLLAEKRQPRDLLVGRQPRDLLEGRSVEKVKAPDLAPPSPMLAGLPEHIRMPLETVFRREEMLPGIGQGIGGLVGNLPGAVAGATAGTAVGEAGKQAVDVLKGKSKGFQPKEIAKSAGISGILEGVTRGFGRMFFRKQVTNEAMQGLGRKLGQMKEAMSANPELKAESKPILDFIKTAYGDLEKPLQSGKTASVLRKWISHLESNKELPAKTLIRMEEQLGKAAKFGEYEKGVFQPAVDIANPQANKVAKMGRKQVSDIVDELAERGGQKGFGKSSRKMSKMIERFPDNDPTKAYGGFGQRLVTSGMAGIATGNPLAMPIAYLAQRVLQSPEFRNAAYGTIKKPLSKGAGKIGKLTLSELFKGKR